MSVYRVQTNREIEEFVRGLLRRFLIALTILNGIVIASTIGLVVLGRHGDLDLFDRIALALWDSLNLISTVGSLEEEFTVGQRGWAMLVIIFGLGAVLFAFGTLQSLLHGGDVRRYFARKGMQRTIHQMSGHVVVCGYGHVGRVVARQIRARRPDLMIIDRDEERAARADSAGYFVVNADCTDENALREAGVDRASGLIATLDTDASNVFLILVAREMNPGLRIVARAERGASRHTLRRAGADRVIAPGEIAGTQLSELILKPRMSDFIAAAVGEGEFEFTEVEVASYPFLSGRTLEQLDLPKRAELIVISILGADGKQEFNPSARRKLERDDVLLAVSHEGSMERLAGLGA